MREGLRLFEDIGTTLKERTWDAKTEFIGGSRSLVIQIIVQGEEGLARVEETVPSEQGRLKRARGEINRNPSKTMLVD